MKKKKESGGYQLKAVCPFLSVGGFKCHHKYGKKLPGSLDKYNCLYFKNQEKCPLYKLWEESLTLPENIIFK